MSEWMKLKAADGNELDAYVAEPTGKATGAIVLVQEIFGVNAHIQAVCDSYAAEGYAVVAPAIFDRFEKGVQLDYSPDSLTKAFALYPKLQPDSTLHDVAAAFAEASKHAAKVAVMGYCYGGLTAWLSAVRGPKFGFTPACSVGYYAGGIGSFATEHPVCPVMLHFGADDTHIGAEQVDAVKSAHPAGSKPEVEVFVYDDAGHAFNREPDPNAYAPAAAKLARERTLKFLAEWIG